MAPHTREFEGADGVAIGADVIGDGPPLLLVHGTSADKARWAPLLPLLEDRFTCIAIDRRGRGSSGDAEPYRIALEFGDIAAVVGALSAAGDPVSVFAHSYGALCSLEASLKTGSVGRLVLYEPPVPTSGPITPPDVLAALRRHAERGDRDAVLETFALKVVRYPPAEYDMIRSLPAWKQRQAAALTIPRELGALDEDYGFDAARFAGFAVPTLLLLGADSPAFLQDATRLLHETLPDSQLEVMPGQQHNAIDAAPALVARLATAFLAPEGGRQ